MAPLSSSSTSSTKTIFSQPQSTLLSSKSPYSLLIFLFLVFLLLAHPVDQLQTQTLPAVPDDNSPTAAATATATAIATATPNVTDINTTTDTGTTTATATATATAGYPALPTNSSGSGGLEFMEDAHEVPSGPNPISN